MKNQSLPLYKVLSIAGSDTGSGAGIQADIKTITALGGYATTAIAALTAQNTLGVHALLEVPASFVGQQIDAIMTDIGADAVKTGMLRCRDVVEIVCHKMIEYHVECLVVDPVMVSKNKKELLAPDAIDALISHLLPLSFLITPNIPEAERISGIEIHTLSDAEEAAKRIYQLGASNVLIKGGHATFPVDKKNKDKVVDVLYDGKSVTHFDDKRIEGKVVHGTGCVYASAIATYLAKGYPLCDAVGGAKKFLVAAMETSLKPGRGYEVLRLG
jgi:hydroxymethylpyrimidine kinase/phosphomethylpyrimidine kinase